MFSRLVNGLSKCLRTIDNFPSPYGPLSSTFLAKTIAELNKQVSDVKLQGLKRPKCVSTQDLKNCNVNLESDAEILIQRNKVRLCAQENTCKIQVKCTQLSCRTGL